MIYSTDLYLTLNIMLTEWCLSLNEYNEVKCCFSYQWEWSPKNERRLPI